MSARQRRDELLDRARSEYTAALNSARYSYHEVIGTENQQVNALQSIAASLIAITALMLADTEKVEDKE